MRGRCGSKRRRPCGGSTRAKPSGTCRVAGGQPPTASGQLDVSQLPDILRAQCHHLAQLHHHRWWEVQAAISDATHAIHSAVRTGPWTPRQQQRLHHLDPGTWPQVPPEASPGWQYNLCANPVIEIAIYPEIVRLAAHNLQTHNAGRHQAS